MARLCASSNSLPSASQQLGIRRMRAMLRISYINHGRQMAVREDQESGHTLALLITGVAEAPTIADEIFASATAPMKCRLFSPRNSCTSSMATKDHVLVKIVVLRSFAEALRGRALSGGLVPSLSPVLKWAPARVANDYTRKLAGIDTVADSLTLCVRRTRRRGMGVVDLTQGLCGLRKKPSTSSSVPGS